MTKFAMQYLGFEKNLKRNGLTLIYSEGGISYFLMFSKKYDACSLEINILLFTENYFLFLIWS